MSSEEWHSPELMAWLFNDSAVKDHVVIDDRWGKDTRHKHGGYYTTEYTAGMQAATHPWEESRGMGFSYGYNRVETLKDYHTERELLMMLIDIVSRGGNLLLDIGPRADGGIPAIMEERLVQMGSWLGVNGEAIYGTHAAKRTRQWSQGTLPKMEDKEFQADIRDRADGGHPAGGVCACRCIFYGERRYDVRDIAALAGATDCSGGLERTAGRESHFARNGRYVASAAGWKQVESGRSAIAAGENAVPSGVRVENARSEWRLTQCGRTQTGAASV